MQAMMAPLTPPPRGLALASKSSTWSVIWRMLGIVVLLYIITQFAFTTIYGLAIGDSFLSIVSMFCMTPLLLLFIYSRRPKLTHVIMATPDQTGSYQHGLTNSRVLQTPMPTRFSHHLIRDSPPLEMPPASTLWIVFSLTVITAFLGLLPVMLSDNPMWIILAVLVGVPAWLFGFSLPVHAWWAFSTRHFQLMTTKIQGEKMLVAGMLSTIPAIVINSLIFPFLLLLVGIESMDRGTIGELLILAVSAPVGEELCKAAFVLSLYKMIDSPKRGFQIGFSVGLGFALLENLQYIMLSLGGGEYSAISYSMTTIIRGIGSIPGHAFWTGLSGVSIGWFLCTKRGISSNNFQEDSTKWVVFDSESGQVINSQRELSKIGKTVRGWLYKPYDRSWNLPRNPIIGISLAILGHSLWNGSSWLVSWMFIETDILVQVIASLAWTGIMIVTLWFIAREILAAVMHLPS
ncbi:MAG: PrsW family intramembrane metalloprotease [Candidatus Poseidoniaceae archaeon]|nr:PrsW family intramembrane metalloprotease [Candidatus Poseidoniaceae archaeon]